jgi:uncharacterized cupin superfamily protein
VPLPLLATTAHPLDLAAEPYVDLGFWKVINVFRGKTGSLRALGAHASVLKPGHSAHPAHTHPGEELCVMLEGALEVELPDAGSRSLLERGAVGFVPADVLHSLASVGEVPAVYLIVRWLADPDEGASGAPRQDAVNLDASLPAAEDGAASTLPLLDTTTDYLRRFRCTAERLPAGGVVEPTLAANDRLLIVLDGMLDAAGSAVSAPGLLFIRAGEACSVSAPGPSSASYLSCTFEPHPASPGRRLVNDALWYSRRSVLRRPMTELAKRP